MSESERDPHADCVDIAIDTNVLLHCRTLGELDWSLVSPGTRTFNILVLREVVREIDRLKSDGNGRRARRARRAASIFDELLEADSHQISLRASDPRVTLKLAAPVRPSWDSLPTLDASHADDRIVAEALSLRQPSTELVLVSNDVGPRHSAGFVGLRSFKVPQEWLLPAEPDERDNQIGELRSQLNEVRKSQPDINISVIDGNDEPLSELIIDVADFPDLTDAQITALVKTLASRNPMATFGQFARVPTIDADAGVSPLEAMMRTVYELAKPSEFQIKQYREVEYPAYLAELEKYLRTMSQSLKIRARCSKLWIKVANQGRVPAERLILDMEAKGDFRIHAKAPGRELPPLPAPPEVPVSTLQNFPGLFGGRSSTFVPSPILPPTRDPNSFYWRQKPHDSHYQSGSLICEEFRHGSEKESELTVYPVGPSDSGGLYLRVTARNLPEHVETILPLRVRRVSTTLERLARKGGVPSDVAELLVGL